jgi:hypothetical protein
LPERGSTKVIVAVLTVSRGRRVITRTAIHNYLTLLPDEWTMAKV